jgi:hypothetical protein
MKRCPTCNRTYTDLSLNFCLEDGSPLTTDAPGAPDPNATLRYPSPRDTAEPPPTEIYHPPQPAVTSRPASPPPPPPPQWSPTPAQAPRKKSNAIWWILGGFAALVVIGAGLVVMLIALASLGADPNTNNLNTNNREVNRNTNVNANVANVNTNANANVAPTGPLVDDFTEKKWAVGVSQYGRIWYDDDQYHMSSKERTYIVMYAPSDEYSTENATVKVAARSVDGDVPSAGFGLVVHGGSSKAKKLEDYALLIYPGDEPAYEIVMHKDGNQSSVISRTRSDAIRTGKNPNQLEIRIKGNELSFYANGQYLTRITDTENYRRGRAGFYTSDEIEVAFDNLEIDR